MSGYGRLGTYVRKSGRESISGLVELFSPWVELPERFGRQLRQRLFSPSRTFWLFLSQVLAADGSCREVVRGFLGWLALDRGRRASANTGGYCRARSRLPLHDLERLQSEIAQRGEQMEPGHMRWYGRRVKVVDGSSVSMPDTPQNQQCYPQPKGQEPGCGFPVMRILAVFSLASGTLLALAKGALNVSERTLFRHLWHLFDPGDVVLADRGLCSYADFHFMTQRNIHCVMRRHQRRTVGLEVVKKLGKADRLLKWHKTTARPEWLDNAQWRAMPDTMLVRQITVTVDIPGFRTKTIIIATTLLDHKQFPTHAFAELYRARWMAELFLRDIKTSMGMDVLRCKTPEMIHKELSMYLIAYNLIRGLMLEAAATHAISPFRISFKGTMATLRQWAPLIAGANTDEPTLLRINQALLVYLARDLIPYRPNRTEPRARKRRPKQYQLLTKPRHLFKEIQHRNTYRKA